MRRNPNVPKGVKIIDEYSCLSGEIIYTIYEQGGKKMKELFEKYSIKLDIDTIINNPDPYTHHLDLYEVQNEVSRLILQLEYLKLLEKQKTAEIYLRFKDSDMKITEKYIESQVNTSEEIRDLRNKIVELDTLVKYLLGIIRILENKTVINNSLLADRRKGILE